MDEITIIIRRYNEIHMKGEYAHECIYVRIRVHIVLNALNWQYLALFMYALFTESLALADIKRVRKISRGRGLTPIMIKNLCHYHISVTTLILDCFRQL